jgi:hypothetical protein
MQCNKKTNKNPTTKQTKTKLSVESNNAQKEKQPRIHHILTLSKLNK